MIIAIALALVLDQRHSAQAVDLGFVSTDATGVRKGGSSESCASSACSDTKNASRSVPVFTAQRSSPHLVCSGSRARSTLEGSSGHRQPEAASIQAAVTKAG